MFSLSYGYAQPGGNNGQIASISDSVDKGAARPTPTILCRG